MLFQCKDMYSVLCFISYAVLYCAVLYLLLYLSPLHFTLVCCILLECIALYVSVLHCAITGRWEPSHSRQLLELGLEPLRLRRLRLCKTFALRTAEDPRHMDLFTRTGTRLRKGKQAKIYRKTISRTATHYMSPLPYLTRLLNGV